MLARCIVPNHGPLNTKRNGFPVTKTCLKTASWKLRRSNKRPITDRLPVASTVSHKFGYGLMDAGAMVDLAKRWKPVPTQHICITPMDDTPRYSERAVCLDNIRGCTLHEAEQNFGQSALYYFGNDVIFGKPLTTVRSQIYFPTFSRACKSLVNP